MRVSGAGMVRAPAEEIWAALADRDLLLRAIPGVDQLDFTGNGRCRFMITIAIAAAAGTYAGEASVLDANQPSRLVLRASAAGVRGTLGADVTVRLVDEGGGATEVSYEADAEVAGPVAGIGERLLVSIAKRLGREFVAGLDNEIAGPPGAPAAARPRADSSQPSAVGRPTPQSADSVEPPRSALKVGLFVGAAVGFAGIVIGAVLGRRNRTSPAGRPVGSSRGASPGGRPAGTFRSAAGRGHR